MTLPAGFQLDTPSLPEGFEVEDSGLPEGFQLEGPELNDLKPVQLPTPQPMPSRPELAPPPMEQQAPAERVPEAEGPAGFWRGAWNSVKGIGERTTDLAGGLLESQGAMGDPNSRFPAHIRDSMPAVSPEELTTYQQDTHKAAEKLRDVDLGYDENRYTLDRAKQRLSDGDYFGALTQTIAAGLDTTATSLPDMAASMTAIGIPPYIAARTGEISLERAKNKGMDKPGAQEIWEAAPFAIVSAALERVLPARLAKGGGELTEEATREISENAIKYALKKTGKEFGKDFLIEGTTEALQEGVVEYVGEKFGTDAEMSVKDAMKRGAEAFVLGGIGGGAMGGVKGGVESFSDINNANPGRQLAGLINNDLDTAEYSLTPEQEATNRFAAEVEQIRLLHPTQKTMGQLVKEKLHEKGVVPGLPIVEPKKPDDEVIEEISPGLPEGFAIDEKATKLERYQKQGQIDVENDSLMTAIGKKGGLNREHWQAQGVDPAEFNDHNKTFGRPSFRKDSGMSADDLAEMINQNGYGKDVTANEAVEMVFRELGGEAIYHPSGVEAQMERAAAERDADQGQQEQQANDQFEDSTDFSSNEFTDEKAQAAKTELDELFGLDREQDGQIVESIDLDKAEQRAQVDRERELFDLDGGQESINGSNDTLQKPQSGDMFTSTRGDSRETKLSNSVEPKFTEENRITNLSPDGGMMNAIKDNNPAFELGEDIIIYRASVGDSIKNGDYVAMNKDIASQHLENLKDRGEAGSITSIKVKPSDLLMANDATEFIYSPQKLSKSIDPLKNTISQAEDIDYSNIAIPEEITIEALPDEQNEAISQSDRDLGSGKQDAYSEFYTEIAAEARKPERRTPHSETLKSLISGQPTTLKHRSASIREAFDDSKRGGQTGTAFAKVGHWLSVNDVGNPERYGDHLTEHEVTVKNPKVLTADQFDNLVELRENDAEELRQELISKGIDAIVIEELEWVIPLEAKSIRKKSGAQPKKPLLSKAPKENSGPSNEKSYSKTSNMSMPNYQGMLKTIGLPDRPESGVISIGDKKVKLDPITKPTRREGIEALVAGIIGNRTYSGQFGSKQALGFYRHENSEVRMKDFGDVEVLSHEMAHFLDFDQSKEYSKLYKNSTEIQNLSYTDDPKLVEAEGFAEYVRLYLTQFSEAQERAPNFTKKFKKLLARDKKLNCKMDLLQREMHKWFNQGALAAGYAATSGNQYTRAQVRAMRESGRGVELLRQRAIDNIHAAKVIARRTGVYGDASINPYKQLQLLNGIEAIVRNSYDNGAIKLGKDGTLSTFGPSLHDVWSKSHAKGHERIRAQELYFAARRASELHAQGRENLFTVDMIRSGLGLANKYPYFKKAFKDYQEYKKNMMEFYVDTGLLTREAADTIMKNNKSHVPFNRVVEGVGDVYNGTGTGFQKLRGGKQNIKPIYENILMTESRHIYAALKARALRTMYDAALRHKGGSEFIAKIPPGVQRERLDLDAMATKVAKAMDSMGMTVDEFGINDATEAKIVEYDDIEDMPTSNENLIRDYFEENPEELFYWSFGHKPNSTETNIDSFIDSRGERVWIEIQKNNELLTDMLDNMDGVFLPKGAAGSLIKMGMASKNIQTVAITSMPQFFIPNLVRDQQQAYVKSGGAYKPLWDMPRGFYLKFMHAFDKSPIYKQMLAQGGPGGGRYMTVLKASYGLDTKEVQYRTRHWSHPAEWANGTLEAYLSIADSFEMATRVSYYDKLIKRGVSPPEAAWQARELTTDFGKRGSYAPLVLLQRTIAFSGAYVQSVDNDILTIFQEEGETAVQNALKFGPMRTRVYFAGMSLVAATVALALMGNEEDKEKYQSLTKDQRVRFYNYYVDGVHYTVPKPHGLWSVFGQAGETWVDLIYGGDTTDASETMAFSLAYHFGINATPSLVSPFLDIATNTDFRDAPIVPRRLENVSESNQFKNRTGLGYVEAAKYFSDKLGVEVSPLKAEHIVRGQFGYAEQIVSEATNKALWNDELWGERPYKLSAAKLFGKQFKPTYERTKYDEKYYELKDKANKAYNDLRAAKQGIAREGMEEVTKRAENTLLGIKSALESQDDKFSKFNKLVSNTWYDPDLSAKEKEKIIDDAYQQKSDALKRIYVQANRALENLKDN